MINNILQNIFKKRKVIMKLMIVILLMGLSALSTAYSEEKKNDYV